MLSMRLNLYLKNRLVANKMVGKYISGKQVVDLSIIVRQNAFRKKS